MKFRGRPVEIEAEQYRPGPGGSFPAGLCRCEGDGYKGWLHVHGRQGSVAVKAGDWIVAEPGAAGFYPCAPEVFAAKYEPA